MKKTVLIALGLTFVCTSISLAANKSFVSGSVYSVGSVSPTPFRPSPKVTINYYTDSLTAGTDWAAKSYHQSAIGNKKGMAYWTAKSEPGMFYFKNDSAGVATTDVTVPSDSNPPSGWKVIGQ